MGVEILVIAIVAGVISLISGATSIATLVHVKKSSVAISDDKTSVDIFNKSTDEEKTDGSRIHTREQKIHIEDIDTDFASSQFSATRTGLPNKTSEILGRGGAEALGGLITLKKVVPSKLIEDAKVEHKSSGSLEISELLTGDDNVDLAGAESHSIE